jgi:hypothetical protein
MEGTEQMKAPLSRGEQREREFLYSIGVLQHQPGLRFTSAIITVRADPQAVVDLRVGGENPLATRLCGLCKIFFSHFQQWLSSSIHPVPITIYTTRIFVFRMKVFEYLPR